MSFQNWFNEVRDVIKRMKTQLLMNLLVKAVKYLLNN